MTNRLAQESSPYLRQHQNNPVDWWPWSPEALARARDLDKPIFVSIGYSSCHWCHVMAHESFEDEDIAALLNEHFLNIKVDREERPDVDSLYMTAVQAMTGHGGWPLNAFLTPDLVPFYGGTYWPVEERQGLPSFKKVIEAVAGAFDDQREEVVENAENIRNFLTTATRGAPKRSPVDQELPERAFQLLAGSFDPNKGGFGGAPKFPQPAILEFLLGFHHTTGTEEAEKIVRVTLDNMAAGGMYDQIGGGFHRYSVDADWLVPHFEKMLYDNAQLSRVYTDAYRGLGDFRYAATAGDIFDYVLREMTGPDGAFFASKDADTEGEEGRFYVWTESEFAKGVPKSNLEFAKDAYGVEPGGNFEGRSIPVRAVSIEDLAERHAISKDEVRGRLEKIRNGLWRLREKREKPGTDEKAIASWNGMMLRSLAEGGRVLDRSDLLAAAESNASFLTTSMWDGTLLKHSYKDGKAVIDGYLDDYANVADGLIALYQATGDLRHMTVAVDIVESMLDQFSDDYSGLLFDSAQGHEPLVSRARDVHDGATPSGNAVAADMLLKLARFTGNRKYETAGGAILEHLSRAISEQPQGFGRTLTAAQRYLTTPKEVAIAGSLAEGEPEPFLRAYFSVYEPSAIIGVADADSDAPARLMPFLQHRNRIGGAPAAYVCEHHACMVPVSEPSAMVEQLESGSGILWSTF